MTIAPETTVAEIATSAPATIRIFQDHQIDYCCGGKIPLAQACTAHGLDVEDAHEGAAGGRRALVA